MCDHEGAGECPKILRFPPFLMLPMRGKGVDSESRVSFNSLFMGMNRDCRRERMMCGVISLGIAEAHDADSKEIESTFV